LGLARGISQAEDEMSLRKGRTRKGGASAAVASKYREQAESGKVKNQIRGGQRREDGVRKDANSREEEKFAITRVSGNH